MSDYVLGRIEPAPQGCICPPTSEQTCQNPTCPRKLMTIKVRAGTVTSEYRQAWFFNKATEGEDCVSYWPKEDRG